MTGPWTAVCELDDIAPNTGVCALVQGRQVAIFRRGTSETLYAVDNYDPIGNANVLSRGLLAQLGEQFTIASPLYKQHYSLSTGECLENSEVRIRTYKVRLNQQQVEVALT